MAITNPLSLRLIYNEINGTSHGANAQIGSGVTLSSLRSSSVAYNNVGSAPDTISEWHNYTHTQSMGSITYAVRIHTTAANYGTYAADNEDVGAGETANADSGVVLFTTYDGSNTYVKAKRVHPATGSGTRTGNVHTGSGTVSLTTANAGQTIITIPVSNVTVQAAQTTLSGSPVSKAAGTLTGTGATQLISLGAEAAESESAPSGEESEEFRMQVKIVLTASKAGYVTTVLDNGVSGGGVIIDSHNSTSAEEDDEEECSECCIHEDMLIATEEDMKSIHDIEIGDSVVSYNFETGENELVEVEDKIIVERDSDYKINDLILTEDHPIYLDTGRKASIDPQSTLRNYKQEVDEVKVGDVMQKLDGSTEEITSIERYEGTHVNYTLKTKHNNFYANDILVSWVDSR